MLVVTVEIWPGGDITRAKEIASVQIANISALAEVSNYMVCSQTSGWEDIPATRQTVTVEGHPRRQGVLALLKAVFNKLGEK